MKQYFLFEFYVSPPHPPPNSLSFLVKEQANKTMEAGYDIDIISSHELNDKQIKMLVQLNDYYDNIRKILGRRN